MRVLVTGANGFIGSHVVRRLLADGHEVRALVRPTSNLRLLEGVDPERVHGDVTDAPSVAAALRGVDVVLHLAGSIAALDEAGFDRVNVGGTRNLVDAALASDGTLRRFVTVSSIAATGPSSPDTPRTEQDAPAPVSGYGRSKLRAEDETRRLHGRIPWTIVRPPIVYGAGDTATLDLYRMARARVRPSIGGTTRRFSHVHVRDLVDGMITAATHPGGADQAFFLTGPEDVSTGDFTAAVARAAGWRQVPVPVPDFVLPLAGVVSDRLARMSGKPAVFSSDKVAEALQPSWRVSPEHAARQLGWRGRVTIEEGTREALDWYRRNGWL